MWREFKPALLFLARFVGVYVLGNILYGLYIASFQNEADTVTELVSHHSCYVLNQFGENVQPVRNTQGPTVFIQTQEKITLNIFEGCNGVNVIIVFVAFMVAFGGPLKKMAWYVPLGILTIHIFNLARISLLFYVAQYDQELFYYVHKYFFTAALYLVVFALWAIWVMKFTQKPKQEVNAQTQ